MTDEVNVGLDVRLDNRHLDLRRSHVNAMFQLRSRFSSTEGAFDFRGIPRNQLSKDNCRNSRRRDESVPNEVLRD